MNYINKATQTDQLDNNTEINDSQYRIAQLVAGLSAFPTAMIAVAQ